MGSSGDLSARATYWAWQAIGNLYWMACGERGWDDGNRIILDAAHYCLTSLENIEKDLVARKAQIQRQVSLKAELMKFREDELKKELADPGRKPRSSCQSRPRMRRPTGLAKRLGKVVASRMERLKARIDPRLVGITKEQRDSKLGHLDRRLRRIADDFDTKYGGIVMAELPGEEGRDWQFGAYASSVSGVPLGHDNKLLPVVSSPNDIYFYLDANGIAWSYDVTEQPKPTKYAPDAERMVARIVLYGVLFQRAVAKKVCFIDGQFGERIALELSVPAIKEANGEAFRAWGDSRRLIIEHSVSGAIQTAVAGPGANRFKSIGT